MASQQDIRQRIRSVRNIRKVTKAMELVSAAKLRRAQARIESLRPFAAAMADLIAEAAGRTHLPGQPLLERRDVSTAVILAVTGDRGLAGGFNANVLRAAFAAGRSEQTQGHSVRWMVVGKKGAGTMRFRRLDIDQAWSGFTDRPTYEDAAAIAHHLVELYTNREVDRVVMIYNAFRSALSQQVEAQEILPVPIGDIAQRTPREIALEGTLLFEPDAAELLASLLPSAVETSIYRALLESTASEHGARMAAMRNASDNAGDLIDGLTLAMNRARQAEITQAILEVVAGADALQ